MLLLLPIPGSPLQAKFTGPYAVVKRLNSVDYLISTPDRGKTKRVCHVNMIKPYHERGVLKPVGCIAPVGVREGLHTDPADDHLEQVAATPAKKNSEVLADLGSKMLHLSKSQQRDMSELFGNYPTLFADVPGRTTIVEHDIVLQEGANPVKQQPYRLNPTKSAALQKEIKYMLENDLIEPSESPWSSPVILVPKPDSTYRMCIDFRKVNSLTKTDSHPIPRVDDCIDRVGQAKYVSKYDILQGYWQVPMTDTAKEITDFVTPDHLYQCKVMAFGLKNAPGSFMRPMNRVLLGLEGCIVFIDDVVIVSDEWEGHVSRTKALLQRLADANLTVNLAKSEIGRATVTHLGYTVGQGKVAPKSAKVEAIERFSIPTNRKQIMRFLGVIRYYRKFCQNFADVAVSLTNLLCKNVKFVWTPECQSSFEPLKQLLVQAPVLSVPDYGKAFTLMVDASDIGVGAVMTQQGGDGAAHPTDYFSKKLNKHQKNYSTIEKETLALVMAVQHFEIYVSAGEHPVEVFTDHNPLKYLDRFRNKNQRLTRWSLFLQEYDLVIRHIPGRPNIIADC